MPEVAARTQTMCGRSRACQRRLDTGMITVVACTRKATRLAVVSVSAYSCSEAHE